MIKVYLEVQVLRVQLDNLAALVHKEQKDQLDYQVTEEATDFQVTQGRPDHLGFLEMLELWVLLVHQVREETLGPLGQQVIPEHLELLESEVTLEAQDLQAQ